MEPANAYRVLVISQVPHLPELHAEVLEEEGYVVDIATTSSGAITSLRGDTRPEVVLLPSRRFEGIEEVVDVIVESDTKPKIIVCTSDSDPASIYKDSPIAPYIVGCVTRSGNTDGLVEAVKKA